jgi:predicted lipoprotein with Yx(FWY)xxD motif
MKKIIILASERSGTNLFRTLLGNHRDIEAPVAPHFLDAFIGMAQLYGDLGKKENAIKLLGHMIRLANHPYHEWAMKADANTLQEKYNVNSLASAFDALYSEKAVQQGKTLYACKDNHMFNYAPLLEKLPDRGDIRYLYLYRDPRDHIVSWMKRPLYMHTPYEIAKKWKSEQQTILDLKFRDGIDMHFIKYEDLISNPQAEMTKVMQFIGIDIDEKCFQTNSDNIESKRNEYWENLSKPIMSSNSKKYLQAMSANDLLVSESICVDQMKALGYPLETAADWSRKKSFAFKYRQRIRTYFLKRKHRDTFTRKMVDMQDKLDMVKAFKAEL